jgi:hypothetical protein
MIPKNNPPAQGVRRASGIGQKSIDVVFDLDDPEQVRNLEGHKAAFGESHTEVEPLGDGKVILKIYPGGAKGLL